MVNVDESYDSFFCFNIVLSPEVFYKTVNREMKGPANIMRKLNVPNAVNAVATCTRVGIIIDEVRIDGEPLLTESDRENK